MGLSSSQARLLNLTSRMHQIEYKAAKIEAEKLQMANESRRVHEDYLFALEQSKIQVKVLNTDGSIDYIDATYNILTERGYQLKLEGEDKEIVSEQTAHNYETANGNQDYFVALETGRVTDTDQTVNGYKEVYTADQLAAVLSSSTITSNVRLMSDINMSGMNISPKMLYNAVFDGNGHSITGLSKALFSYIYGNNAVVKNLNVSGNSSSNAILANTLSGGKIENVKVSGSVNSSQDNVGALVGTMNSGTINSCSVDASVVSTKSVVGVLVGQVKGGSISNCSAKGTVHGDNKLGGFAGTIQNATVSNCSSNSNVTGTYLIIDNKWGYDAQVGGFAASVSASTISYCSSSGDTYAEGCLSGGFVSYAYDNTIIQNCDSYVNVHANTSGTYGNYTYTDPNTGQQVNRGTAPLVAGFIGGVHGVNISNSNAYGSVDINDTTAAQNITYGGFVAGVTDRNSSNTISNCYTAIPDSDAHFVNSPTTDISTQNVQSTPVGNSISVAPPVINPTTTVDDSGSDEARDLFNRMAANGYATMEEDDPRIEYGDDNKWLTNMVNEGQLFIYKPVDFQEELYQVSVAVDTNLQEVEDKALLRKAEAKYEADMKRIDLKDRKFDYDLAALDNERNAIKQEIETLKTVAKDNVERTFKLFS